MAGDEKERYPLMTALQCALYEMAGNHVMLKSHGSTTQFVPGENDT